MTDTKPATDDRIDTVRFVLRLEDAGKWSWKSDFVRSLIARIDTERAARLAAKAQLWKPGDPRCDACDNGIANAWAYCAWCGTALKEPANG